MEYLGKFSSFQIEIYLSDKDFVREGVGSDKLDYLLEERGEEDFYFKELSEFVSFSKLKFSFYSSLLFLNR